MNDDTKPKKRGRKPKTNIIINDNPVFKNNNFDDVIVCINNIEDNNSINNILCDNNDDYTIPDKCTTEHCKNCRKALVKDFIELPQNYIKHIFYVNYKFCSLECAHRYSYDNLSNYNEILSLLYLYYNKLSNNSHNNIINIAKPVSTLIHNGGTLTIDKYCSKFTKIVYSMIPYTLNSCINIIDNKEINNNKIKNLKLYRSNKINKNKNNIFNKMNLDISSK
jgi:hypothetical protein